MCLENQSGRERRRMMKKIIFDILGGLLLIVLTLTAEFIVTLPFTEIVDQNDRETLAKMIDRELLLAAIPVLLLTFFLAWVFKTLSMKDAIRRSSIWTVCLLVFYLFIGFNNKDLDLIFTSPGIYAMLVCAFAGPVLWMLLKRKPVHRN